MLLAQYIINSIIWTLKKVNPLIFNSFAKTIESILISDPKWIASKKKVRHSSIQEYRYPKNFDEMFRKSRYFPERYCFILNEGIVLSKNGLILTPEKKILLESYGSYNKLLNWNDFRTSVYTKTVKIFNGKIKYFIPNRSFYHLLIEEIPAFLHAIESFNIEELYVLEEQYTGIFYEILNLIIIKKPEIKIIKIKVNCYVDQLVFTQRDTFSGAIYSNDIQLINSYLLQVKSQPLTNTKIYLSRSNNPKRSISNEIEIENALKRIGFEIIYAENMSFMEQINMMRDVKILVSPHGAGLSHMIWKPNLRKSIIEIFPSYIRNDCFASMAMTLEYRYSPIFCQKQGLNEYGDIEQVLNAVNNSNNF